jgi:hypothetical protein
MRRFISYFNALLLGVILGMIFVAIADEVPLARSERRVSIGIHCEGEKQILHSPPPNLPQRADALWGPWYVRGPVRSE